MVISDEYVNYTVRIETLDDPVPSCSLSMSLNPIIKPNFSQSSPIGPLAYGPLGKIPLSNAKCS